jgi:hypothetical protein
MTYNFDPDKWYENELYLIRKKHEKGEMTRKEYDRAVADLDRRLAAMWQRLDGTYQVGRE